MPGSVSRISVAQPEQMQLEITRLVSQGFVVANQTNRSVTLIKRKQVNIPVVIIGFLLCVIPLIIYLIVYSTQSDQIVEIQLVETTPPQAYRASEHLPPAGDYRPAPNSAPVLQLSPDGQSWWDGTAWRSTQVSCPPNAVRNEIGTKWWDGESWRPVPPPHDPELPSR